MEVSRQPISVGEVLAMLHSRMLEAEYSEVRKHYWADSWYVRYLYHIRGASVSN